MTILATVASAVIAGVTTYVANEPAKIDRETVRHQELLRELRKPELRNKQVCLTTEGNDHA